MSCELKIMAIHAVKGTAFDIVCWILYEHSNIRRLWWLCESFAEKYRKKPYETCLPNHGCQYQRLRSLDPMWLENLQKNPVEFGFSPQFRKSRFGMNLFTQISTWTLLHPLLHKNLNIIQVTWSYCSHSHHHLGCNKIPRNVKVPKMPSSINQVADGQRDGLLLLQKWFLSKGNLCFVCWNNHITCPSKYDKCFTKKPFAVNFFKCLWLLALFSSQCMACLISLTTAPFCFGETRQQMTSWSQQGWVGCCDVVRMWNLLTHAGYERNDASHFQDIKEQKTPVLVTHVLLILVMLSEGLWCRCDKLRRNPAGFLNDYSLVETRDVLQQKSWKLLLSCNVNPKKIWRTPTFSHLFTFWSFFIFSTSFMIDFSTQKNGCTKRNSRSIFHLGIVGPFHFEAPRPIRGISHRWPFPQTCASSKSNSWENMEWSHKERAVRICLMEFCRK